MVLKIGPDRPVQPEKPGTGQLTGPELWGVIKGLQLAITHNWNYVIMESNSLDAINFIKHGCPALHSCASLVKEIRILSSRIQQVHWNHILRETNSVADILAKKGQSMPLGLHIIEDSIPDIFNALSSDCMGFLRLRETL
ncbi:uncharacterized protein LOC107463141 [Arachis duranensis]|uniref:Uncharacterized protein LOC107463141 n=1 Tax=Arachis duranensis TaxID=130453 RepID=A0A6P4B751_ARADU|nr:uncharacterized protein LOC107463141 [Arachis duranensis]